MTASSVHATRTAPARGRRHESDIAQAFGGAMRGNFHEYRRRILPIVACGIMLGTSSAASVGTDESCPLARTPYSVDAPLIDLLLNSSARKLLEEAGLLQRLPPAITGTQPPTFSAIISVRVAARYFGVPESELTALDASLSAIPVTAEDARARCARYDLGPAQIEIPKQRPAILIFDKSTGFRDGPSVDAANAALRRMSARRDWTSVFTSNAAVFEPSVLAHFDAVVWNNVSGDVLTIPQRAALRQYVEQGGGFAAFHGSGGDPLYVWDWYADDLIGARFSGHPSSPQFQDGRLIVEDRDSPITRGLGEGWTLTEEWYSFRESPRLRGAHILVTLDEASYRPLDGGRDLSMGDHPIAWTRCVKQGRSFYSALGHRPEIYADEKSMTLLENGIAWAAGLLDAAACK